MANPSPSGASPDSQATLRELAELLRSARHLDPDSQVELAELVDDLRAALSTATLPSEQVTHLTDTATHLVHTLHEQRDRSIIHAAKRKLEVAARRAEAAAPVASGIVRRLLDLLAEMGI